MNLIKLNIFRIRQFLISLGPILITISLGLTEGYSAILLPQLGGKQWNIDTESASWIASSAILPMFIGCLLGGWLMEVVGRKMLHIATCIPNIIGWLFIGFSGHSLSLLLVGRLVTGLCVGVLSPVLMVYVAETSDPVFRGFLLSSVTLALNLGIALAHVMGTYLTWKLVALLACILPVACFFLMLFVPESPTFLIKKGHIEKAKDIFFWFREESEETKEEINELISMQQQAIINPKKNFKEHFEIIKEKEFYKPLLILMVFYSTMQWSGCNPMTFYTIDILEVASRSSFIDSYESMHLMELARIIASISSCFAQQYMKRRKLMILSCSGTIICLMTLSFYIFIRNNFHVPDFPAISVICFVGFIFFTNFGLLPLPYSMTGELFGYHSRGLGSGLVTCFNMILMFIIVKVSPWLFQTLTEEGVFLLYSLSCLVGMLILIKILPETLNKPLYEIEECFKANRKNKTNLECSL